MTAPEESPVLVRSLYPTSVVLPDGTALPLVKLVVSTTRVYAFVGGATGVELAYSSPQTGYDLQPPWQSRGAVHTVQTPAGVLSATNLGGCGCAAQALRAYRPFPDGPERLV